MPSLPRSVLLSLFLLLHPALASAQGTGATLHPGDEVRVHAPDFRSDRVRGTVVLYQGESLDVRESGSGRLVSIPVASIRRIARNEGRDRGRSAWRTARFGAFVGGAGGLVAGPLIATSRAPKKFGEVMLASSIVGTLGGLGAGAIVGAVFARDQWQSFRPPVIPTVGASLGSAMLGFSIPLP